MLLPPQCVGDRILCWTCVFGFRASVGRSEHLPWHHSKGLKASKRQHLWRCNAVNRPPTRVPAGRAHWRTP